MKYVKLGNSGVDVSRVCLGMMSFGKPGSENGVFPWAMVFEDAKPLFKKAIELGINFFDTANVYQLGSSEEITGKLIREFNLNRDEIVVATKVNFEMRAGRPNGAAIIIVPGGAFVHLKVSSRDYSQRRSRLSSIRS